MKGELVRASDVPISETLTFLQAHLPPAPARLLEVGCGDGALAARLQALGYQVVAIDSSAEAVARARERGLDARQARWPDFDESPLDAVLFTRSLHHIHPLDQAVAHARQLLRAGGRVLVEDFAFSEIEPLAAHWLYQVLALLEAAGVVRHDAEGFASRLLREGGDLETWHAAHDHDLHAAGAMLACLREYFTDVQTSAAPYLYRYVCALLAEDTTGYHLALRVLELEKRFAQASGVSLIGRRFVGRVVSC
jgi:SAM-dependent methyltransferase